MITVDQSVEALESRCSGFPTGLDIIQESRKQPLELFAFSSDARLVGRYATSLDRVRYGRLQAVGRIHAIQQLLNEGLLGGSRRRDILGVHFFQLMLASAVLFDIGSITHGVAISDSDG